MAALFTAPPLHLPLPEDIYQQQGIHACWRSRRYWVAHNLALYDRHYSVLRRARDVSVSRKTFANYLRAESGGADFRTGRNCRLTVAHLQRATWMSESTMHRCRRLAAALGTRSVVFTGRQRTKLERLASWYRGDPGRGWAAVAALHESSRFPVDNETVKRLVDLEFGTPPGRSPGSRAAHGEAVVSPPEDTTEGRAPRGIDKRGVVNPSPAYDPRAVKMASRVRRDERFPLWVRQIPPGRLAAVLTRKARAGWDVDDIYDGLGEYRISGKALLAAPHNPPGYLWSVLDALPDDMPPGRYDRARTVAIEESERLHRQRQREEARAKAMQSVPMTPAAQQVRDQLGSRGRVSAAQRARVRDAARQELAELARRQHGGTR